MGWERDRVRMEQEEDGTPYVPIGQRPDAQEKAANKQTNDAKK